MATSILEIDIVAAKSQRAACRQRELHAKREEYQRSRSAPRPGCAAPADRVRPHRLARCAARTFLSRGLVSCKADMPAIKSMGRCADVYAKKKPAVAAVVKSGTCDPWSASPLHLDDGSDAETTASEGLGLDEVQSSQHAVARARKAEGAAAACTPVGVDEEERQACSLRVELEPEQGSAATKAGPRDSSRLGHAQEEGPEVAEEHEPLASGMGLAAADWEVLPTSQSCLADCAAGDDDWSVIM